MTREFWPLLYLFPHSRLRRKRSALGAANELPGSRRSSAVRRRASQSGVLLAHAGSKASTFLQFGVPAAASRQRYRLASFRDGIRSRVVHGVSRICPAYRPQIATPIFGQYWPKVSGQCVLSIPHKENSATPPRPVMSLSRVYRDERAYSPRIGTRQSGSPDVLSPAPA